MPLATPQMKMLEGKHRSADINSEVFPPLELPSGSFKLNALAHVLVRQCFCLLFYRQMKMLEGKRRSLADIKSGIYVSQSPEVIAMFSA